MVFVCFSIAIYAFILRTKKHRKWAPVTFGALGLIFLSVAAFGVEEDCCTTLADELQYRIAVSSIAKMSLDVSGIRRWLEGDDSTTVQDLLSQFALWITTWRGVFSCRSSA